MISVILNVYKRPYTLEKQIDSILNQSIEIKPENIHIWYNANELTIPKIKEIKTYKSSWNTKFFGRFTVPLLCRTPYIAMFDDDVYPQHNWFKNCISSMEKQEGLLGGSGVVLQRKSYEGNYKIGWNGIHSSNIERVDLVGHAWFFKQEWAKYLWYEKPISWENGEDIMFSYLLQKYGNINTFVPPHPLSDGSIWSTDIKFAQKNGMDKIATSMNNISEHYRLRNLICVEAINNGWDTVKKIK